MADAALRADGVSKRYGDRAALRDVTLRRRPRRARRDHRAQRRRQDDAAADPRRARSRRPRARSRCRPSRSAGCRSSPRCTRSSPSRRTCGCSRGWRRCGDVEAAVARMLEQTDLAARAGDEVGRLSGGNQQRVNIAIGLLRSPAALLLDEPSASLDPRQRERLWGFIGGLAARGHRRRLLDPRRRRGRALRRPRARAGRRRAAVHGHAGRARAGGRRRAGLRVGLRPLPPRAGPLSDALAAAQGPADPAPLAAAGRRC